MYCTVFEYVYLYTSTVCMIYIYIYICMCVPYDFNHICTYLYSNMNIYIIQVVLSVLPGTTNTQPCVVACSCTGSTDIIIQMNVYVVGKKKNR